MKGTMRFDRALLEPLRGRKCVRTPVGHPHLLPTTPTAEDILGPTDGRPGSDVRSPPGPGPGDPPTVRPDRFGHARADRRERTTGRPRPTEFTS